MQGGTASIVLPQNWLFLTSYRKFREKLLQNDSWHLIARLGPGAFETISGEVVKAILINLSRGNAAGQSADLLHSGEQGNWIRGMDVSAPRTAAEKAARLLAGDVKSVERQGRQLEKPDAIVSFQNNDSLHQMLEFFVHRTEGLSTGDLLRIKSFFWEILAGNPDWVPFRSTVKQKVDFGGMEGVLHWCGGHGPMNNIGGARITGQKVWGSKGILISQMQMLPTTIYGGQIFDE